MRQTCIRGVVVRPGNTAVEGPDLVAGSKPAGPEQQLLQFDELLLETSDLLMAFAQLLQGIDQNIRIHRRCWFGCRRRREAW